MDRSTSRSKRNQPVATWVVPAPSLVGRSTRFLERFVQNVIPGLNPVGSGPQSVRLRTHNQEMTEAAMQIALKKVWAQRS